MEESIQMRIARPEEVTGRHNKMWKPEGSKSLPPKQEFGHCSRF